jgi:HD superfamily phosphohydrolase
MAAHFQHFLTAMDYLPIQASTVPCEQIFSSSAETDIKKQNHISLLLMEALQMLKFHLKKEHLNFTESWVTSELQMTKDDLDADLLDNLLRDVRVQDALDGIMKSIEVDKV